MISFHVGFWVLRKYQKAFRGKVENLLICMMTKLDQLLKILLKSTAVHTLITKIKNTRMCGQWKYFLKKNLYYFFQIWTSVMSCVEWNKKEDLLQDQALRHLKQVNILGKIISNLFVTAKNETTNSRI